jgi:hypothetical protein
MRDSLCRVKHHLRLKERINVYFRVRYYPVLASLQLQNIIVRFLVCLYVIGNIVYTIIQVSCVGFLPLPRYYSTFGEVEIRTVGFLFDKDRSKFFVHLFLAT